MAITILEDKYNLLHKCMKLEEVEALSTLNNYPNIIKLDWMSFLQNEYFLVFEYMDINLHHLFKQRVNKPFSKVEIRKWMLQILKGV